MKLIKEITDMDILGTEGYSEAKPRITARAIIQNMNGLFALMYSGDYDFYSFPGGGVEKGEDIIGALKREVKEETGCNCAFIKEIGCIRENRAYCNFTQISNYYFVKTNDIIFKPSFTEFEKLNMTTVNWYSLDDVIKLINIPVNKNAQVRFLKARDVAVLNEFLKNRNDYID